MSEWITWWGRLSRLALLAAALIVLASVAAAIADVVQILTPPVSYVEQCSQHPAVVIIAETPGSECQWEQGVSYPNSQPALSLTITENKTGRLTATAVVKIPSADPVAVMVRHGAAESDSISFVESVVGSVAVNNAELEWAPPILADGPHGDVTITDYGTELPTSLGGPGDTAPLAVQISLNSPGSVHVTTLHRVISGIQGATGTPNQSARAVTVPAKAYAMFTVNLANDAAQLPGSTPAVTVPRWLSLLLSFAWGALSNTFQALLPAVPWLGIFLVARAREFGTMNLRAPWTRLESAISKVLIADLVISAARAIDNQESTTISALIPQLESFPQAMLDAGFWATTGFPQVDGGAIVLLALVLGCTGWWSSRSTVLRPRPSGAALGLVCFLAAICVFVILVGSEPNGSSSGRSASGLEFAITAVLALACAALGGALLAASVASPLRLLPLALASQPPRRGARVRGLILALALAVAATLIGTGIATIFLGHRFVANLSTTMPIPITPVSGFSRTWVIETTVALLMLCVAAYAATPWLTPRLISPVRVAGLIAVLSVAATMTSDTGFIPVILRWGMLVLAGSAVGLGIVRLLDSLVSDAPRPKLYMAAVVPIVALVAIPWGDLHTSFGVTSSWSDVLGYASAMQGFLGLALVAAGCVALRELGSPAISQRDDLRAHRRMGIAAWIVALSGSYTLLGTWDSADVVTLAVAAAGAWVLFPSWQVDLAAAILGEPRGRWAGAIRQTLRAGTRRRLLSAVSRNAQDKIASGDVTLTEAQRDIAAAQRGSTAQFENVTVNGRKFRLTSEQRGFGMLTSTSPWARGRWGLVIGTLTGAPWVVLGLAGTSFHFGQASYPELLLITSVAPLVIRWAAYGLLFGYFFPLLRGRTGLEKALWFAVVAAAPTVCATLATGGSTASQWDKAILLAIQVVAYALTMGILADRAVLREHGIPGTRLVDVHNLWVVSAWVSSITVAVAAGLATAIIAGLQPFVIGVIEPSLPAPTASVSTHQPQSP